MSKGYEQNSAGLGYIEDVKLGLFKIHKLELSSASPLFSVDIQREATFDKVFLI